MPVFKKIEVPRSDSFDEKRRLEYHTLLRESVFPFIDESMAHGLADGYDFLSHSSLDLRLWLRDRISLPQVQELARRYRLPDQLIDWAPAETGDDRVRLLEMLRRGAQQVRALLEDGGRCRSVDEVVHWFLNQYGFHNAHEIQFHESAAAAWKRQLASGSTP